MNVMSRIIFAIEQIALLAVITVPAQLDIVCCHLLLKAQTLYICVERDDYIGDFVARDDGHAGTEFTSMNMQVCAADLVGCD